jgi:hypothetical protein
MSLSSDRFVAAYAHHIPREGAAAGFVLVITSATGSAVCSWHETALTSSCSSRQRTVQRAMLRDLRCEILYAVRT